MYAFSVFSIQKIKLGRLQCDVEAVRLLLQYHANISAVNRFGQTPLHHACRAGAKGTLLYIVYYIYFSVSILKPLDQYIGECPLVPCLLFMVSLSIE